VAANFDCDGFMGGPALPVTIGVAGEAAIHGDADRAEAFAVFSDQSIRYLKKAARRVSTVEFCSAAGNWLECCVAVV
jgi:hypothetical protein